MATHPLMETGKARNALVWGVALFLLGQAAFALFIDRHHPEMRDPVYAVRLAHLRKRRAEAPGRPLLLALGSSRVANGFCPAEVERPLGEGSAPLVFNFGAQGGGPVMECLLYRRLTADGLRPDFLLAEVWAPHMPKIGFFQEAGQLDSIDLYWSDLFVFGGLCGRWGEAVNRLLGRELAPAIHRRAQLLDHYAPFLLPLADRASLHWDQLTAARIDPTGWLPVSWPRLTRKQAREDLVLQRRLVQPAIDGFHIDPVSAAALRELLEECRAHGTRAALLLMPEHHSMRRWYTPAVRAEFARFVDDLGREFNVPVIDARTWSPNRDFHDAIHLLPDGARALSARLGRDVLRPWLAGQALPPRTLLAVGSSSK
jgi:hypothetical protein